MKRLLILFSVFLNVGFVLFSIYLYLGEEAGKAPHGIARRTTEASVYSRLNLSLEQEKSIKKLLDPYVKDQKEMRTKNKELQKKLMEIIANNEKPNSTDANRILEEIASLKGLRERSTVEHLMQVKRMLNEEQSRVFFDALRHGLEKEKE